MYDFGAQENASSRIKLPHVDKLAGDLSEAAQSAQSREVNASHIRIAVMFVLIAGGAAGAFLAIDDPLRGRAAALTVVCLGLWLTELIPLYATTMILLAGATLLLAPLRPEDFSFGRVLTWSAQPVMALFFGGFALSVAGAKFGLDAHVASWMLRISRGRRLALLATVMAGTALLSMWMCNIAAAAMMIVTLGPMMADLKQEPRFRIAMLLAIAFAADFGGMATPIGTGPNLIAIGAVAKQFQISFLHWMLFALPLTILMLALTFALLAIMHGVRGTVALRQIKTETLSRRGWMVVGLFAVAIAMWLTESLHGVPAAVTAMAIAGALFAGRLLDATDIAKLEWDTLMLIAGGLTLGELLSRSGLAQSMASAIDWRALPPMVMVLGFVLACAFLSAVASNTAAAAMLIQIGLAIIPQPQFAVIVALAASMGVPFVISTPPNALVFGQGGVSARDLAIPGLILTTVGCVLLAVTGPTVLTWLGIP